MILFFRYQLNQYPRRFLPLFLFFLILLGFQWICSRATAQPTNPLLVEKPDEPWHITADSLEFDTHTSVYIGKGHVDITKGEKHLTADRVRFDRQAMTAQAEGNVMLSVGDDLLSGRRLDLDLRQETATLYNGSLFMKKSNWHIAGDKIEKTGKDTYAAQGAQVTTCDGDVPDWKITARDLKVTIEGYGSASHAALWARKVPVLYAPYLRFPVKLRRQTGFLTPLFGTSSRKGFEVEDPFFWAISDSTDATLYYDYLEKRGNKLGLEYRYVLSENSQGAAMFDWLDDDKVDDGRPNSGQWGYTDDAYLRPNHDRYWFRMKHDQNLPSGFSARLDLDVVSDQDYLTEFRQGLSGYDASQRYFLTTYGRGLDDYNDPTRVNRLNLSKSWTAFSFNAQGRWTDNVIYRNLDLPDPTVQQLPEVDFNGSKQRIGQSPFYYTLNSQYAYLYRQDGTAVLNATSSHRADLHPRMYLPFDLKNYLNIEPSLGVRETAWYVNSYEQTPEDAQRAFDRELADARLDLTTDLYRIYAAQLGSIDRIRHTLQPKVTYEYIPGVNQEELPNFDATDRIAEKSLITYSLTNTFTYRAKAPRPSSPSDAGQPDKDVIYHQFARLKVQQSYDLLTTVDRHSISTSETNKPPLDKGDKPFSAILTELEIVPKNYFSIKSDAQWSVARNQFDTTNVVLSMWDDRQDRLSSEYRYGRFVQDTTSGKLHRLQSIFIQGEMPVTENLTLHGVWERDLDEHKDLQYGGGFKYTAQCWAIDLAHAVEEQDHRYYFIVELYGLGKIGN